jgi:rare lipoprotein A
MTIVRPPFPLARSLTLLTLVIGLGGCAGTVRDGPGVAVDPGNVPAVVPKSEPKSAYGNPESYEVFGRRYHVLDSADGYAEEGMASWYGSKFHGRRTSSGETYNMYAMTAAHKTLPLPTYVRVTNLDNGRSAILRVNDRGPFHDDRLIDLSYTAAVKLGVVGSGTAPVRVEAVEGGTPSRASGASTASTADPDADVYVQVGAFRHFVNAQEMRARVQGADIRGVEVDRGTTHDGEPLYRVRIGPLDGIEEGDRIAGKLRRAGIGPAHIVAE